jgi:hypothetical protein
LSAVFDLRPIRFDSDFDHLLSHAKLSVLYQGLPLSTDIHIRTPVITNQWLFAFQLHGSRRNGCRKAMLCSTLLCDNNARAFAWIGSGVHIYRAIYASDWLFRCPLSGSLHRSLHGGPGIGATTCSCANWSPYPYDPLLAVLPVANHRGLRSPADFWLQNV